MPVKALGLVYLAGKLVGTHPRIPIARCSSTLPKLLEIRLNLIVPPSTEPQAFIFDSPQELRALVRLYHGALTLPRATNKVIRYIAPFNYDKLSPTETYEIVSPFHQPRTELREQIQVSDKDFEEKARLALIAYMRSKGLRFHELNRFIQDDTNEKTTVAEGEGAFQVENDGLYFLECKHSISTVLHPVTTRNDANTNLGDSFFTR